MAEPKTHVAGGRDLVLLPFTIATAEAVLDRVALVDPKDETVRGQVSLMVDLLALALARGNAGVDAAWIREHVEMDELRALYEAAMRASGRQDTAAAPGEAASP